jgi:hypothetical protein
MKARKDSMIVTEDSSLQELFRGLKSLDSTKIIFKADKINSSGLYGVELIGKFNKTNPKKIEPQEINKGKTIWDKLWLFVVEQSITVFFQFIIMNYPQFFPHIIFLILSLLLVI